MNRIEILREYVDKILLDMSDNKEIRNAYLHLYGVAQSCSLIALKRGENAELAVMSGMLHDIYSYAKMDTKEHANKGATLAREILSLLDIANEKEINLICNAIYNHSDKESVHDTFTEVLIDADVMQHCLYNPMIEVMEHEKSRYMRLKIEFDI